MQRTDKSRIRTFEEELERVHLQWFADPAPEEEGEGAEEEDNAPLDEPEDRTYDGPIEFVVEDDPEPEPEGNHEQEVAQRIQELSSQVQGMQGRGTSDGQLAQVLGDLSGAIRELKGGGKKEETPAQKPLTKEDILSQYKDDEAFFKNPAEAVWHILEQFTQTNIAPAYGHLFQQIQGIIPEVERAKVSQNEDYRLVLENWGEEVNQELERLNGAFGAKQGNLQEAINMVSGRHIADLWEKKQAASEEKAPAKRRRTTGVTPQAAGGSPPPSSQNDGKVRITRSQMEEIRNWQATKPISMESAMQLWLENGKKFPF